jgi:REP element-mobilizing transposase RayT
MLGTANKLPLILPDNEKQIHKIMGDCFKNQGCETDVIEGTSDHIHVLFKLNPLKSIDENIVEILSESKALINNELFPANSFGWNPDYAAFSVSESQVTKVVDYIKNQKETHKTKSYQKELDEFLVVHGMKK